MGDKRERLVAAAVDLIHKQGFHRTTLADIAKASDVPLGNVYYYFKTKDDIVLAVIERYLEEFRTWVKTLEKEPNPMQRLLSFLAIPESKSDSVVEHGCPIGSLAQELCKESLALADKADEILKSQLDWVIEQFRLLGKADAELLGQQFIAHLQGASLLGATLKDPTVVQKQAARLREWLQTL